MKSAFLLLRPRTMLIRIHILYASVPFVEYCMLVLGISVSATLPVNCSGTKVVLFIVLVNYWRTPTVIAVPLWRIVVFAYILYIIVCVNCSDFLLVNRSVVMAWLRDLMFPQWCTVEDSGLLRRNAVSLAKCFTHFRSTDRLSLQFSTNPRTVFLGSLTTEDGGTALLRNVGMTQQHSVTSRKTWI